MTPEDYNTIDLALTAALFDESFPEQVQAALDALRKYQPEAEPDPTVNLDPLKVEDGPIALTYQTARTILTVARFATMTDALTYLDGSTMIDPAERAAGRYGIDAPEGLATDQEAYDLAIKRGFQIWRSMGGLYWAEPGASVMGNTNGVGWRHVNHADTAAAAWQALSRAVVETLEPGDIAALTAAGYTVKAARGGGFVFIDPQGARLDHALTTQTGAWLAAKRDARTEG